MYNVARVQDEAEAFCGAVERAEPFRPLMVKMKLTWQCNLVCGMCDYWRQDLPTPLTLELVSHTLDDLAALGCRKVHFSGGEPTLRPDLPDIIAHARHLKLRVTLTTNGTLITHELAKRLVVAGLNSVCVSIDSPVRSVHDRIRGAPGAFKQTIAGVRALHRAAKQRGLRVIARLDCNSAYQDALKAHPEWFERLENGDPRPMPESPAVWRPNSVREALSAARLPARSSPSAG